MDLVYGTGIDLDKADVFIMMNEHSYAAFMGVLSNIYMKAHAISSLRTSEYSAALIINESMTKPYKTQPESSLTRLKSIIARLSEPAGGINLSVYVGDSDAFAPQSKVGLKHSVSQCWPLRKSNTPQIITGNASPDILNKGENIVRYAPANIIAPFVDQLMDYGTPISEVFGALEKSKAHICYQGGTAWLSIAMNIPTFIVHPTNITNQHHLKTKVYGQDLGNINIIQGEKIMHVRKHPHEHHVHISHLKKELQRII